MNIVLLAGTKVSTRGRRAHGKMTWRFDVAVDVLDGTKKASTVLEH